MKCLRRRNFVGKDTQVFKVGINQSEGDDAYFPIHSTCRREIEKLKAKISH